MRPLSDTIARLAALRQDNPGGAASATRLQPLTDFGSNPGSLNGWFHVPDSAGAGAPLVVVLHGCTQDAASYDRGAGWTQLADAQGFAVLYPEQRRANNGNLCFNWFEPGDSRRDAGEPASIAQMIEALVSEHRLDRTRIYITGLSAGGAMTSTMLATYPEIFAGGAIIAGLPFAAATNVQQALERMRGHGGPDAAALASAVRTASSHPGPWPSISIWHGTADHVVAPANADAMLAIWQAVHGVPAAPAHTGQVDGHAHRQWHDAAGKVVIEEYRVAGMGHGTPLAARGDDGCGQAGPHMLEAGISSTRRLAEFWKLAAPAAAQAKPVTAAAKPARTLIPVPLRPRATEAPQQPPSAPKASGVGKVIEDALRAAGLMR